YRLESFGHGFLVGHSTSSSVHPTCHEVGAFRLKTEPTRFQVSHEWGTRPSADVRMVNPAGSGAVESSRPRLLFHVRRRDLTQSDPPVFSLVSTGGTGGLDFAR